MPKPKSQRKPASRPAHEGTDERSNHEGTNDEGSNDEGSNDEGSEELNAAGPALVDRDADALGVVAPEDNPGDADEVLSADAIEPPAARGALAPARNQVERFLAEVRSYPRLSDEEERVLGKAVRDRGDRAAARKLVVHNLRLVVAIAYQYRRAWANILDLFQEGSVGVMEAVKRWEPTLGPRFGTYAAYWIRAYVLRFLMTNSRLIHVGNTRAGRKLFFRLEKERQKLLAGGFEPTPKLLAAKLDVDEEDLADVSRVLDSREVSFDPRTAGGQGDEGLALAEKLASGDRSPEAQAEGAELASAVRRFMTSFQGRLDDERERAVWREHLAADEPAPLGELGARFGVSKQRMGQIADRLKKRFREEIVRELGPDVKTVWQ
ncbi:MAG TPA: sigma-70 family RNA polymerase sigma factor [Polyangia bacterium]|nr:sigma-70 family RNA polymerase sigma factor [Polyangia bacterium]